MRVLACILLLSSAACAAEPEFRFDPRADGDHFPIAVWLQHPRRAPQYQAAGINLYVGLWKGPTAQQLQFLRMANMPVICSQNEVGLAHKDDPIIVGWLQQDEPDNAQSLGEGKGYGPPVPPAEVIANYERLRAADPTRPVFLNLGQGVAYDKWKGRGVRTGHPEDYVDYVRAADIVSFDIYPVVHRSPDVAGDITFVAKGIDRLREWTKGEKHTWNCIECTRIQNRDVKPTPAQVRAEVWLSIIHGSRGIIYFVHEWQPKFNEKALLDDAEMLQAVTETNHQIRDLAVVINSSERAEGVRVEAGDGEPIHWTTRGHNGWMMLFAVNVTGEEQRAELHLADAAPKGAILQLVGDRRGQRLPPDGIFEDTFDPWEVRFYRWKLPETEER